MNTIDINLILWLVFFCWHYCLFCGFISDDHAVISERKDIIPDSERVDRGEGFWLKRFNDGVIMFYQNAIFKKLGMKYFAFPWHLFSLLMHILNTYLLYLFLTPIIGGNVALYACAFWAVNPMHNQCVVWISGRPYLWGTFLALIGMICYQDPITFFLFYALAVITNVSIVFSPIILYLAYPEAWQTKLYLIGMLVFAFPFIGWKFHQRFKGLVLDRDNFRFKKRKINTFARMTAYYIFTLFFPVRMGWYHQAGFRYNERWEKFNYLTFLGYVILGLCLFYFKFPGWWFILGLIPVSNIYATNSFLQDRYLYFCSIGVAAIISPVFIHYPELFYIAMTFYITRSYMYSRHLKDDEKLYRENWRNHPKSDYAVNNLSYFLIQQGRFDEARVVIEHGLNIDRSNKMLWYNLGITFVAQGHLNNEEGKLKFIRSLDCFKTCLQLEPRWSKPYEDLKRITKYLVENKVLSLSSESIPNSVMIELPNVLGINQDGNTSDKPVDQTPKSLPS